MGCKVWYVMDEISVILNNSFLFEVNTMMMLNSIDF